MDWQKERLARENIGGFGPALIISPIERRGEKLMGLVYLIPEREPATSGLEVRRSVQLSYAGPSRPKKTFPCLLDPKLAQNTTFWGKTDT